MCCINIEMIIVDIFMDICIYLPITSCEATQTFCPVSIEVFLPLHIFKVFLPIPHSSTSGLQHWGKISHASRPPFSGWKTNVWILKLSPLKRVTSNLCCHQQLPHNQDRSGPVEGGGASVSQPRCSCLFILGISWQVPHHSTASSFMKTLPDY